MHLLDLPRSDGWLYGANDLYRRAGEPPVPALLVVPDEGLRELHARAKTKQEILTELSSGIPEGSDND